MKFLPHILTVICLMFGTAHAMLEQDDFQKELTRGRLPQITCADVSTHLTQMMRTMHSATPKEKEFIVSRTNVNSQRALTQYKWMWASAENQIFAFRSSDLPFPPIGTLRTSFVGSMSMGIPHEYIFESIEEPGNQALKEMVYILAFPAPLVRASTQHSRKKHRGKRGARTASTSGDTHRPNAQPLPGPQQIKGPDCCIVL